MKILEDLDIKYKDITLYEVAFIHSSYSNEHKLKEDYERLEFLGDKVIDLVVSEYLYKLNIGEGEMTKIRASHVCENSLYRIAIKLNFQNYVKVVGAASSGGKIKKAILADVFEAFVAAIYLDRGLNEAKRFLNKTIIYNIKNNKDFFNDYKSILQEELQTEKKSIKYIVEKEEGPSHNKIFTVIVKSNDIIYGRGKGKTKKEAEQNASKDALDKKG